MLPRVTLSYRTADERRLLLRLSYADDRQEKEMLSSSEQGDTLFHFFVCRPVVRRLVKSEKVKKKELA